MESYEQFKARNAGWGDYFSASEKSMRSNYEIALEVEKTYNEKYGNIDGPKKGDIVEFSDGFRVYKHAKIVEDVYGKNEYGLLTVCENGGSFTDGIGFSTSGGAFVTIHKSLFKCIGKAVNIVWTWGCYGAGENMGIYFPLEVRKWIVPYKPIRVASTVTIYGKGSKDVYGQERGYAVCVRNFGDSYISEAFVSIKAFLAWAEYVGYKHTPNEGAFNRVSPQKLVRKFVLKNSDIPKDGKPLKMVSNGRIVDAWAVNGENEIDFFVDHRNSWKMNISQEERDEEIRLYRKYSDNPLGI